ncbi:MAG: heat-inducible transcription repressor HrcA [Firmicutes bacterium]|nr:heat-inducible transcription repressor HrcA [Bacillota bacterium]MBQ6841804.1 heat-inducible transcription repressor HrcA [Bacillota bacterium]
MDERKKQVLNAIIQDYISSAEPVGSRAVAKKYDLGVSPATIRNEMSDLEDLGYIEQPHTSAGRVPSQKGYRYFVDNLMQKQSLTPQEMQAIRAALAAERHEMDAFMRACCQMVARLTNYATMVALPYYGNGNLAKLQLVPLGDYRVMAIMLSDHGLLRHRIIDLPEKVDALEAARLERLLSERLVGTSMDRLEDDYLLAALSELDERYQQLSNAFSVLQRLMSPGAAPQRVFTGGARNILSQPEFRDPERLDGLFSLLEEQNKLSQLLDRQNELVSVAIGEELADRELQDCSMVVANYYIDGEKAGAIGVLGPTRMSYSRTVSLLEFIAGEIGETLSQKKWRDG